MNTEPIQPDSISLERLRRGAQAWEENKMPIDNSLRIDLHEDGSWTVTAYGEDQRTPDHLVSGKLTDFEIIELFRYWVIEGTPDLEDVGWILQKARQS